jgi:asparagine synthase (glutamine-hydrolysing)
MSVIAGIHYFDRRPIADAFACRVSEALQQYAADGSAVHSEPGLLMVHQAVHVTPEDGHSHQPLVSRRGTVLTWDGRLDNREEIARTLGRPDHGVSDAELVLEAWDAAGHDALGLLVGDWSLAMWCPHTRTLVLASDYMGVRPLCYHYDSKSVAWSTSAEFLDDLAGPGGIDEQFILGYLTFSVPADHTPYAGIRGVSPAHSIAFTAGKAPVRRSFWDFPRRRLRYSSACDYDEHFKQLVADAVRVRLRSCRPVWAELSGGLDSSAIVCVADRLMHQGRTTHQNMVTVSRFSSTSIGSDERRFIRIVHEQVRRPEVYVCLDDCLIESLLSIDANWPNSLLGAAQRELELMQTAGARVLLSGRMGDTVMGNMADDTSSLAVHLKRGALPTLVQEARRWALATKQPIPQVLWSALVPMLPVAWQFEASHREFLRRQQGERKLDAGPVNEAFSVKPSALDSIRDRRLTHLQKALAYPELSKRRLVTNLYRYSIHRELESATYAWQAAFTYPYGHRPLVEFALSIPQEVLVEPGERRLLMRRALADTVPPRILQRFSKSAGSAYKARCVRELSGQLLGTVHELEVVERGYIEPESLRRRIQEIVNGSCHYLGNMLSIVTVERWLRAYSARSRARLAEA